MLNRFRKVAQDCKLSLVAATADDTDVVVCVFDLHICIYFLTNVELSRGDSAPDARIQK
jgi:hypothetical protein